MVDGQWKAGLWVRDSTAGIGTLTFYDPATEEFGGLGHGVCDTDTSKLMPFLNGEILPVTISGVTKGASGAPGELHGYFEGDEAMGVMYANDEAGVYVRCMMRRKAILLQSPCVRRYVRAKLRFSQQSTAKDRSTMMLFWSISIIRKATRAKI